MQLIFIYGKNTIVVKIYFVEVDMKSIESISKKQMICITVSFLIGSSLIILTGLRYAQKDIFICEILALILGIFLALIMGYIVDKHPGMEYTEILDKLFKPVFGKVLAGIYLLYSICIVCFIENNITGLITTMVMPETPSWMIIITITLVVAYIMSKGIEEFALSAEILFPFILFSSTFIYIALIIEYGKIENVYPIFTESISNIFRGTIDVFFFPFVDSCILIFVFSLSKNRFKKSSIIKTSYLLVAPFLIVRSEIVISVLGLKEAMRFAFPLFESARLIQIGRYLERLELILLISWIFTSYIKLAVCYYVVLKCIDYIFNLNDYKKLSLALVILVTALSLNIYSGVEDIYSKQLVFTAIIKITMLLVTMLVFIKTLFCHKNYK